MPVLLSITEEKDFSDAVKTLDDIEGQVSHNNASTTVMLRLYGLYKQKMEGDIMEGVPNSTDIVRLAKFHSWKSLEGMDKRVAALQYIAVVQQLVKQTELAQNQRRERAETSWKILAILIAVMSIVMLLHQHGVEILPSFHRVESVLGFGLAMARSSIGSYRIKFDSYHFYWGSDKMFGWKYLQSMFAFPHSSESLLGIEHLSSSSVPFIKDEKSTGMYGSFDYIPSQTSNQDKLCQIGNQSLLLLLQWSFGIYLLSTLWQYNTKQRRVACYQRLSDFFASLFRFCFTTNTTVNNITSSNTSTDTTTTDTITNNNTNKITTSNITTSNITTNNTTTSNITTSNTVSKASEPTKAPYSPAIRSAILHIPSLTLLMNLNPK